MSRHKPFDRVRARWRWLEAALRDGRRVGKADLEKYLLAVQPPIPEALERYRELSLIRGRGRPFKAWTEKDLFIRRIALRWYDYYYEITKIERNKSEYAHDEDYKDERAELAKMRAANPKTKPSEIAGKLVVEEIRQHLRFGLGWKTLEAWITEENNRRKGLRRA